MQIPSHFFFLEVWAAKKIIPESFVRSTIDLNCFLYLKEWIVVVIAIIFGTS